LESRDKIYTFSAKRLQRIRRKIERMCFFQVKGDWQKSPVSPMDVINLFDRIRIRDGYELVAYVFRGRMGGNGVVWGPS
jgi:hypothetical protein